MTKMFKSISVNSLFFKNGNTYSKVSSRTGLLVKPLEYAGKRFYFDQNELVSVN